MERVIVYKLGGRPTERESHGVILGVLSQPPDNLVALVARSIIEQTRVIPILEQKEWEGSPEEFEKVDIDPTVFLTMPLCDECVARTPDSKGYRIRFILSGRRVPDLIRSEQMQQVEKLVVLFRTGKAGPQRAPGRFNISSQVLYELFTPGQLLNKDIWVADDTIISPRTTFFPPALIGKGVWIEDNAVVGPGVILALNSRIGQWSIISQSIVTRVRMGEGSTMSNVWYAKGL